MHADRLSLLTKTALLGSLAAVILWMLVLSLDGKGNIVPQSAADNSYQEKSEVKAPEAILTEEPPPPIVTPSRTPVPFTPTVVAMQPAVLITHTISTANVISSELRSSQATINSDEAIQSMAWAPTGDKLLYVTTSGALYWSDTDGANVTLLHQYEPDTAWNLLDDQQPKSNTLLLTHRGPDQGMRRGPGHIDVVRFSPGQPPTIEEVHDAGVGFQIHWWSPDRASDVVSGGHVGSEKLVTLDADGHVVEELGIPYMASGAVSPGGQWLAYVTSQQSTDTPLVGSEPETVYLLNLVTGERKQVTVPGQGYGAPYAVRGWSPDGKWFLMGAYLDGALMGVMVSADGHEWMPFTPHGSSGYDATWRADSQQIAFSVQRGGQEEPSSTPVPYSSSVYVVDIPSKTIYVTEQHENSKTAQMMQPKWSPSGSQLALLSNDPYCVGWCSELDPAIYLLPGR